MNRLIPSLLALSAASLLCAEPGPPAAAPVGSVTLKQDLIIEDEGSAALPAVKEGEVFPSPGLVDEGFLLLCRDAEGKLRLGLLPVRDEWGHVAAHRAEHDASLAKDTLRVTEPLALRRGYIRLRAGERLPVVRAAGKTYTVQYAFGDYVRQIPVGAEGATFEPAPPPEKNPARLREAKLAQRLEAARAEQAELGVRLQQAEADAQRIATLIRDLDQAEIEKNELSARIAKNEAVYAALTAHQPAHPDVRDALRQEVGKTIGQQGEAATATEKTRVETDALRRLRAQALAAEEELEQLKTDLATQEAQLGVLLTDVRDPAIREDVAKGRDLVAKAAGDSTEADQKIQQLESTDWLKARMEEAAKDNAQLRERLQALQAEYDKLRQAIRSGNLTVAPEAPAPTPAAPPARKGPAAAPRAPTPPPPTTPAELPTPITRD